MGGGHRAVGRAPGTPEWRERAAQARDQEAPLLIDPGFFWTLDQEIATLGPAKTLIKRGTSRNELTECRYARGRADDFELLL